VLPPGVVTIRTIGDTGDYWTPGSVDGVHLALEAGEQVLSVAHCEVRSEGTESWTMPGAALVVTDRRIGFLTTKFDSGGGWAGFGVAGLAFATVANEVSKRRAAARSAGLVAIGQVRHEWLTGLALRRKKALIGVTDTYVDLSLTTKAGPQRLTLWGRPAVTEQLARWLATVVAGHRLALPVPRTAEQTEGLKRYVDGDASSPKAGDLDWRFPGDATALIRAVAPLAARRAAGDPPQPGDRPMVAVCPFGAPSPDPATIPAYDQAGRLVLEASERVLWQGPASAVLTTAAQGAHGREVFQTMWSTAGATAEVTLTDRRLAYALVPGTTGAPVAAGNLVIGPADPASAAVAGQVRHHNVPNLLALDGAEYGAPGLFRCVASLVDPPATVIRVHLLFPSRESACDEMWIRAIAVERMAALPEYAATAPEKWATLTRQADRPTYADGHYGPAAQLPLMRVLGADRPR
jgi:hypothetical protein